MVPKSPKSTSASVTSNGDYVPPTTGILSKLPPSCVPYAELVRLQHPHGIYMIYFPHIIGLMYACSARPETVPGSLLLQRLLLLFLWTFFMRGAGCAWNDNTDRGFDRKTERCRNRPIARGAVSPAQGHLFALALTLCGFLALRPLPREATVHSGRRPGLDHFPLGVFSGTAGHVQRVHLVFYDTIYARQDTADDLKSGVKGMAVLFRNHIESLLTCLALSIAGLLATAGTLLNMGTYFFAFSVVGLATGLFVMIALIRWHVLPSFTKYAGWFYAFAIANLLGGCVVEYLGRAPAMFA
nr:Prenyltransferase [Thelonectria discophora]